MPILLRATLALVFLLIAGCATAPANPPPATVLLVSVDGLRPTDITPATMPALNALADANVRAVGMRPSYPSLTFPNPVSYTHLDVYKRQVSPCVSMEGR